MWIVLLLRGDIIDIKDRWKTLVLRKPDPLDTFDQLNHWHNSYSVNPIYFFLVGEHSKFDGNLPADSSLMQKTVRNIALQNEIGVHPSYNSNSNDEIIRKEINSLQTLSGKTIFRSRQHFLRMNLPETYQSLIKCGIKEDYTMGFAEVPGFRAGTCTPFPFYDLSTESETELMVYPLVVMDATFLNYLLLSPDKALELTFKLIDEVKKVKGTFISLWHNSLLSDIKKNKGWQNIYPQVLKKASKEE